MSSEASREKLERDAATARALYAAWNTGGVETMVADFWHPDIVWYDAPEFPDSRTHRGRDAVAQLMRRHVAMVGHFQLAVVDVRPARQAVIAELAFEARGETSGLPMQTPLWHVLEFRDDRVIRCQMFLDGERARRAAA